MYVFGHSARCLTFFCIERLLIKLFFSFFSSFFLLSMLRYFLFWGQVLFAVLKSCMKSNFMKIHCTFTKLLFSFYCDFFALSKNFFLLFIIFLSDRTQFVTTKRNSSSGWRTLAFRFLGSAFEGKSKRIVVRIHCLLCFRGVAAWRTWNTGSSRRGYEIDPHRGPATLHEIQYLG